MPVATKNNKGLKSIRDSMLWQELRCDNNPGYVKIKINNNNSAPGYGIFKLYQTNGTNYVEVTLNVNYKSKVSKYFNINKNIDIHIFYDDIEECTYFLGISTSYSGSVLCFGTHPTFVRDIEINIIPNVDTSNFTEIL